MATKLLLGGQEFYMTGTNDTPSLSGVGDKISEAASEAKEKISSVGRTAADKINENRQGAASSLANAASSLHQQADSLPGGEKVASLAHTAADKLGSTADYVREHDVNSMMADVERLVRNNPGQCLLGAAVVGFLVGRAFSNND
jgi:ElaB/YqjD/DUF883 family membrane-anchored ribosome-binding protein